MGRGETNFLYDRDALLDIIPEKSPLSRCFIKSFIDPFDSLEFIDNIDLVDAAFDSAGNDITITKEIVVTNQWQVLSSENNLRQQAWYTRIEDMNLINPDTKISAEDSDRVYSSFLKYQKEIKNDLSNHNSRIAPVAFNTVNRDSLETLKIFFAHEIKPGHDNLNEFNSGKHESLHFSKEAAMHRKTYITGSSLYAVFSLISGKVYPYYDVELNNLLLLSKGNSLNGYIKGVPLKDSLIYSPWVKALESYNSEKIIQKVLKDERNIA